MTSLYLDCTWRACIQAVVFTDWGVRGVRTETYFLGARNLPHDNGGHGHPQQPSSPGTRHLPQAQGPELLGTPPHPPQADPSPLAVNVGPTCSQAHPLLTNARFLDLLFPPHYKPLPSRAR